MKVNKYVVLKDGANQRWGVSLGHVEFHRELCTTEDLAHGLVDGGGMWHVDHEAKVIIFYGKSDDFGYPKNIADALSACYAGIKDEVADLLDTMEGKDYDLTNYSIAYADEGINLLSSIEEDSLHMVAPRHGGVDNGGPVEIRNFHGMVPTIEPYMYAPSYKSKGVPKIKPKNYDKKKKAKRKAQKQSRRHK